MINTCIICGCELGKKRGDADGFILRLPHVVNRQGQTCIRIIPLHVHCAQRLALALMGFEDYEATKIAGRDYGD